MKISIIIPNFNQENYIKECLESILANNFYDYEIIVIDDASTDKSVEIIKKFKHVKLIEHKKNKGIGYTRNEGIKKARGEYIAFIDSDDYVASDFFKKMYENAKQNKSDMVICDYNYVRKGRLEPVHLPDFEPTNLQDNERLLLDIPLGPCNKLYKRAMLLQNHIEFPINTKYEDVAFVALCMVHSNVMSKENTPLNYFRVHTHSETTTRDEKVFDIIKQVDFIRELLKENKFIDDVTVAILLNYTIQQRYQHDIRIADQFIEEVFAYFKTHHIDYKNSIYLKERPKYKTIIEKSESLSKLYCRLYKIIKGR